LLFLALVGAQSETYRSPPSGAVLRCLPRRPHPETRCAASRLEGDRSDQSFRRLCVPGAFFDAASRRLRARSLR